MTSKPPYEMAASGQSDSADSGPGGPVRSDRRRSVAGRDGGGFRGGYPGGRAEDESAYPLTPPPMSSATPPPSRRAPTLMGLPLPSLPLPGVTAAAPHDARDDDITVLARPSVTDDEEEATKVEPAETALHAAASKDDDEVTTALSAQASVERERALRKSLPPSLDLPLPHSYGGDSEFEDPEDSDGIGLVVRRRRESPSTTTRSPPAATRRRKPTTSRRRSWRPFWRRAVRPPRWARCGGSLGLPRFTVRRLAGAGALRRLRRRAPPDAEPRLRRPLAAEPGTGARPVQLAVLGASRAGRLALRRARPIDGTRADAGAADPGPLGHRRDDGRHQLRILPKRADARRGGGRFRGRRLHLRDGVRREVLRRPRGGHRGGDAAGARGRAGRHSTGQPPPPRPRPRRRRSLRRRPPPRRLRPADDPRRPPLPAPPPAAAAAVAEEAAPAALKPAPKPVVKRAARPAVVHKTTTASLDDLPAPKPAAPAPKAKPAKAQGQGLGRSVRRVSSPGFSAPPQAGRTRTPLADRQRSNER